MADFLEQYQLHSFAPIVQRSSGVSGAGAMGAVAARPEVRQGSEKSDKPWSPVQPEPESCIPDTDRDWRLIDRVRAQSTDIWFVVLSGAETGSIGFFSWLYPEQQLLILGMGLTGWSVVQIVMILTFYDD